MHSHRLSDSVWMHTHASTHTHTHARTHTHTHTHKCKLYCCCWAVTLTRGSQPGRLCIKQPMLANSWSRVSNSQEDWPSLPDNIIWTQGSQVICTPENSRSPFAARWTGGMVLDGLLTPYGGGERGWLHQINWDMLGTWTHYLAIMSSMSYLVHYSDIHTHARAHAQHTHS